MRHHTHNGRWLPTIPGRYTWGTPVQPRFKRPVHQLHGRQRGVIDPTLSCKEWDPYYSGQPLAS